MVRKYTRLMATEVPQSEQLSEQQVLNNAGGYVFHIDDWARLDRFLILGSDEPTYYQKARDLTIANAKCVSRCWDLDWQRTAKRIAEISDKGRAAKNDAAIFALAMGACHKEVKVRVAALDQLSAVCRTGTHLFQFVDCARSLGRGWGRALKHAVANWYDSKKVEDVAYQAIKYRSRENYTHKRLLQTAHPPGDKSTDRTALYRWICAKEHDAEALPTIVGAHLKAMASDKVGDWTALARKHNLPWEALPTEANAKPEVWNALLPKMGLTALVRNLGNMSRVGTIVPLSEAEDIVVDRLADQIALRKSRFHPFTILQAMAVYESGHGMRGSGTWNVSKRVVDALDDAFYKAFDNVEPTGKRTFIGLDVSGSMSLPLNGSPVTVAAAAAAMAMVTMRTEKKWHVLAFDQGIRDLGISARDSLKDVVRKTNSINGGGTDCSLPMVWAAKNGIEVDIFQVITDNETWHGNIHPSKALQNYRKQTGINAKLVVMGMTATQFSIADPNDAGMLDCVGFDTSAPAIIADFCRQ